METAGPISVTPRELWFKDWTMDEFLVGMLSTQINDKTVSLFLTWDKSRLGKNAAGSGPANSPNPLLQRLTENLLRSMPG